MENRKILPGQIYRHFKNRLYQIITIAEHSETQERYVVYQALYGSYKSYIRPYDMFISEVDHDKYPNVSQKYRFELAENLDEQTAFAKPDKDETKAAMSDIKEMDKEGVNPYLMEFFDKDSSQDKIEYLNSIKSKIDDRLINDIAASLDLTIEAGDIDARFYSLINCLQTMARFECGRLR